MYLVEKISSKRIRKTPCLLETSEYPGILFVNSWKFIKNASFITMPLATIETFGDYISYI